MAQVNDPVVMIAIAICNPSQAILLINSMLFVAMQAPSAKKISTCRQIGSSVACVLLAADTGMLKVSLLSLNSCTLIIIWRASVCSVHAVLVRAVKGLSCLSPGLKSSCSQMRKHQCFALLIIPVRCSLQLQLLSHIWLPVDSKSTDRSGQLSKACRRCRSCRS